MGAKTKSLVFGPYQVLEKIGQGSASRVFKARHQDSTDVVTLKVGWKSPRERPKLARQIHQEFELGRKLHHTNLVDVLDRGMEGTTPYLVTQFCEGPTLESYLEHKGRMQEKEAIRVFVQVAHVLHYLHQQNLVHHDVRPSKILLSYTGRIKLMEKSVQEPLDLTKRVELDRIEPEVCAFTAPELLADPTLEDPRSDIYSLAICMYLAVTGEMPFGISKNSSEKKAFVPVSEKVPDLSSRIDQAIRSALQSRVELRTANYVEFVKMLTGRSDFVTPRTALKVPRIQVARKMSLGSGKWPHPERRVTIRFQVNKETTCQSFHDRNNGDWKGFVQDVSITGVCLRLYRRFEVGALLQMETEAHGTFLVRVRRVQDQSPRAWLLGCSFMKPLDSSEMEAFLEAPVLGKPAEAD